MEHSRINTESLDSSSLLARSKRVHTLSTFTALLLSLVLFGSVGYGLVPPDCLAAWLALYMSDGPLGSLPSDGAFVTSRTYGIPHQMLLSLSVGFFNFALVLGRTHL